MSAKKLVALAWCSALLIACLRDRAPSRDAGSRAAQRPLPPSSHVDSAPQTPPMPDSKPPQAQEMVDFFAAQGVVYEPPAGTIYGPLIHGLQRQSPSCVAGAEVNPKHLFPGVASLYFLDFPADRQALCARSPSPRWCEQIPDNCAVLDQAIFCDFSYLRRQVILAEGTYFYAHSGTAGSFELRPKEATLWLQLIPPEFYAQLSEFHDWTLTADHPAAGLAPPEILRTTGYAQLYSSRVGDLMMIAALGLTEGHEYAHVEQHLCRDEPLTPKLRVLLSKYEALACLRSERQELAADLRGIELLVQLLSSLVEGLDERTVGKPLSENLGPAAARRSAELEMKVIRTLQVARQALMWMAIKNAAEYDALFGSDPQAGRRLLAGEPPGPVTAQNGQAIGEYYVESAMLLWNTDAARRRGGRSHILPTIRAQIALTMLDFELRRFPLVGKAPREIRNLYFEQGRRLDGLAVGDVFAIQAMNCGRTELKPGADEFFNTLKELWPDRAAQAADENRP